MNPIKVIEAVSHLRFRFSLLQKCQKRQSERSRNQLGNTSKRPEKRKDNEKSDRDHPKSILKRKYLTGPTVSGTIPSTSMPIFRTQKGLLLQENYSKKQTKQKRNSLWLMAVKILTKKVLSKRRTSRKKSQLVKIRKAKRDRRVGTRMEKKQKRGRLQTRRHLGR